MNAKHTPGTKTWANACDTLGADIRRLEAQNAALLAALEWAMSELEKHVPDHIATDPDGDYGKKADEADAAIAAAKGGAA